MENLDIKGYAVRLNDEERDMLKECGCPSCHVKVAKSCYNRLLEEGCSDLNLLNGLASVHNDLLKKMVEDGVESNPMLKLGRMLSQLKGEESAFRKVMQSYISDHEIPLMTENPRVPDSLKDVIKDVEPAPTESYMKFQAIPDRKYLDGSLDNIFREQPNVIAITNEVEIIARAYAYNKTPGGFGTTIRDVTVGFIDGEAHTIVTHVTDTGLMLSDSVSEFLNDFVVSRLILDKVPGDPLDKQFNAYMDRRHTMPH